MIADLISDEDPEEEGDEEEEDDEEEEEEEEDLEEIDDLEDALMEEDENLEDIDELGNDDLRTRLDEEIDDRSLARYVYTHDFVVGFEWARNYYLPSSVDFKYFIV